VHSSHLPSTWTPGWVPLCAASRSSRPKPRMTGCVGRKQHSRKQLMGGPSDRKGCWPKPGNNWSVKQRQRKSHSFLLSVGNKKPRSELPGNTRPRNKHVRIEQPRNSQPRNTQPRNKRPARSRGEQRHRHRQRRRRRRGRPWHLMRLGDRRRSRRWRDTPENKRPGSKSCWILHRWLSTRPSVRR